MKSHLKHFLMIFTVMMIVLTACVSQPEASITKRPPSATPTEVVKEQTASEAATKTPETQTPETQVTITVEPILEMDALIREKLAGHHDIERVYRGVKTREEWIATLDRMIGYGAQITEEEKLLIVDYLVNRTP